MSERVGVMGLGAMGTETIHQLVDNNELTLSAASSGSPAESYKGRLSRNSELPGLRNHKVEVIGNSKIVVDGHSFAYQEFSYRRDPNTNKIDNMHELNAWKEGKSSTIIEATGVLQSKAEGMLHIGQGADVVVSVSPAKGDMKSVSYGINHLEWDPDTDPIVATESCTTNCAVFPIATLDEHFGVISVTGQTTHTRTGKNVVVDSKSKTGKDPRRSRDLALNIIPTTTGAQIGLERLLNLEEKGVKTHIKSRRVNHRTVSLLDMVIKVRDHKGLSTEKIMEIFEEDAEGRYKGSLGVADRDTVSSDHKISYLRSIIDPTETVYLGDGEIWVTAWYPNVFGPTKGGLDLANFVARR